MCDHPHTLVQRRDVRDHALHRVSGERVGLPLGLLQQRTLLLRHLPQAVKQRGNTGELREGRPGGRWMLDHGAPSRSGCTAWARVSAATTRALIDVRA